MAVSIPLVPGFLLSTTLLAVLGGLGGIFALACIYFGPYTEWRSRFSHLPGESARVQPPSFPPRLLCADAPLMETEY